MKKMLLCLLSILLILATLLSGCASAGNPGTDGTKAQTQAQTQAQNAKNTDPNVNPAGVFPIVKEKITLSAFIPHEANISEYVNNEATIELEKRTNIKLTFVDVPLDAVQEKKRLLLASGDYPDMFLLGETQQFTNEDIMMYGNSQKIFRPLNDFIDNYGFEVKKRMESVKNLRSNMTTPDGNIYGLSVYEPTYHMQWAQKMWMNQAWLDKLVLKLPETTDELYTVLKAFKEKDPNGNGKADEIALTGAAKWENGQPQHYIMNAFIYTNRKNYFFVKNDGKLDYAPSQPEWKEGLKYMNKLYNDGLLDPAAFTQTMAQVKQLGTNPEAVLLGSVTTLHPGHFVNLSDDPKDVRHKDYVAVPPLKGPEGVQYAAYFGGIQGAGFVITDKCKYPEAAFRLGDYFYGEDGTLLITEGPEGINYAKAKEGQKNILGQPAKYERLSYQHAAGSSTNTYWGNSMFRNRGSEFDGLRGAYAYDQDTTKLLGYEPRLFKETQKYDGKQPKEVFTSVFLPAESIDEAFQLKVNLEDYVNQSMVRFIIGEMNLDKDWDTYQKKLQDLNLTRYLEIYGKAYDIKKAAAQN